jgi:superfamily II RNA helicase
VETGILAAVGSSVVRRAVVGEGVLVSGEYPARQILMALEAEDLTPAILFRTSRRQCDQDVVNIYESERMHVSAQRSREIRDAVDEVVGKYGFEAELIYGHPHYDVLLQAAAGAHHAGQLLHWRLLLEELMSMNLLRLLVATGTVAAGVDFPARTVVITAHSKRGAEGFQTLSNAEFQQMSGRAGRRGKDMVGFCCVAPGPFSDARVFHEIADSPPEPLRSAYFAAPSTVLNLLKYRNVDDLHYTVGKSLAAFIDAKDALKMQIEAQQTLADAGEEELSQRDLKKMEKRAQRKMRDAESLRDRQVHQLELALSGLRRLGHIDGNGLTEKGLWAAELCTSLVLELAEGIEAGVFSGLSADHLAALVGSIAGDAHRTYFSIAKNPIAKEEFEELQDLVDRVSSAYRAPTNASETEVVPAAALTVLTWLDSADWPTFAALLRLAGVAEGDAARLITQTADHLSQMTRLTASHPDLVRVAEEARSRLLRPPLSDGFVID